MSYSARNISPQRQIKEGLTDRDTESSVHPETFDDGTTADRSIRIQKIVMGINPEFDTHMSEYEWGRMLDAIQATPDQRRLFEETMRIQHAAESKAGLTPSDLFDEEDDPGCYVEQE